MLMKYNLYFIAHQRSNGYDVWWSWLWKAYDDYLFKYLKKTDRQTCTWKHINNKLMTTKISGNKRKRYSGWLWICMQGIIVGQIVHEEYWTS